jgi:chromosome segregation ATPase
MLKISPLVVMLALALALGGSRSALAQVERSGGANAQLAMQYQQLQAEKTQFQSDNAKLKADLDAVKKQLDAQAQQLKTLKAGAGGAQAALAAAQVTGQRAEQNLTQTTAKLQELILRYREVATTLRQVEAERADLQQQVSRGTSALDQCAQRNEQLYQINDEILNRYEHEGAFSRIAAAEPFTRIKRTQIENIALEDRQRAEASRMQRATPPPPPGAAPPIPPAK